eukprot:9718098-Karenia_brevis.AAC.1
MKNSKFATYKNLLRKCNAFPVRPRSAPGLVSMTASSSESMTIDAMQATEGCYKQMYFFDATTTNILSRRSNVSFR